MIALVVCVESAAICIHIYDKKKKAYISQQEKENLKRLLKKFEL